MAWNGRLLQRQSGANGLDILRIDIGQAAADARPGGQAEFEGSAWPLMRASVRDGWVEILVPANRWPWPTGETRQLTPLDHHAFNLEPSHTTVLAVGEQCGLAPILFLSDLLRRRAEFHTTVLLGEKHGFPVQPAPSRIIVPHLPAHVIATLPLLEDWHIACRLALPDGQAGCHEGPVGELVEMWLAGCETQWPRMMVFGAGDSGFCQGLAEQCRDRGLAHQLAPVNPTHE